MAVEILQIESFLNDSIDLVSLPVRQIDLCSYRKTSIVVESYYCEIFTLESRVYLEELE